MRRLCLRLLCISVAALCGVGCTRRPGHGSDARQHFSKIAQTLLGGSLAKVYPIALTPTHQADLNALWLEARDLVSSEEFDAFKTVLKSAGPKIASLCALGAGKSPALGILASKARDLPGALGLDTLEDVKKRDLRAILESWDKGFVSELLKAPDVKTRLESLEVQVVAEEGDWAKLRFSSKAADGASTEEVVDVVSDQGSWLPTGWVADWKGTMEGLKAQIAQLKEAKKTDPDLVKKGIQDLAKFLDDPTALLSMFAGSSGEGSGAGGK